MTQASSDMLANAASEHMQALGEMQAMQVQRTRHPSGQRDPAHRRD
ncbi:hypothetical protein [Pseudomonas sp. Leaf48]|nr:hypothetical protein [Pseudomonas sp. Leaf48]